MSWRAGIHGYAARWNVVTAPLMGTGRPVRFARGCFVYDARAVEIWFMHNGDQAVGTGAELDLELWEDAYGLAFAFVPPPQSWSLVCGIADGRYDRCSVGFRYQAGAGPSVDHVTYAPLHEISIAPSGACPGALCWHGATPLNQLPPQARAVAPGWHKSRLRALTTLEPC